MGFVGISQCKLLQKTRETGISPDNGEPIDRLSWPWRRLLDPEKSATALRIALEVAGRLVEPAQVETAVINARLQSNNPKLPQWVPYGFAQGYAGLALLWGQLDRCFPNNGWDAVAHEHLELAAEGTASQRWLMPGTFSGFGGLPSPLGTCLGSGTRYTQLQATLDRTLIRSLSPRIEYLDGLHGARPSNAFDVISGLSGLVPHILGRRESAEIDNLLIA